MEAAQAAENHGVDLILTMRDIYINSSLNPLTNSIAAAAEALSLKVSSHGTSPKWSQRLSQSVQEWSQAMWRNGASRYEFDGESMETEKTTWSEFPSGGKAIVEQILVSEERSKSKRAGLWEAQSGIGVEKLTIWVSSFQID